MIRPLAQCSLAHLATAPEEVDMLHYAVVFFVIAIIAALLGFSGIAGAASNIAWILFVVPPPPPPPPPRSGLISRR